MRLRVALTRSPTPPRNGRYLRIPSIHGSKPKVSKGSKAALPSTNRSAQEGVLQPCADRPASRFRCCVWAERSGDERHRRHPKLCCQHGNHPDVEETFETDGRPCKSRQSAPKEPATTSLPSGARPSRQA